MTDAHAVIAAILSLAVLHLFVNGVGFRGHPAADATDGAPPLFLRLTVVGYALALGVSAFLLWSFGRFDGESTLPMIHATVVLGLPAAVRAAAARLILENGMTPKKTAVSRWEWLAASASSLIVAAAIGTLLVHALRERTPPDLMVVIDSVEAVAAGFLVRITVNNQGQHHGGPGLRAGQLRASCRQER